MPKAYLERKEEGEGTALALEVYRGPRITLNNHPLLTLCHPASTVAPSSLSDDTAAVHIDVWSA